MTQKEKAQAYDEALERAKKYNIDNAHGSQGTIVKLIFPELQESDDETIRKEIIEFIYYKLDLGEMTHYHRSRVKYWIKYLEKQKEQKPAEWSEEDESILNTIIKDVRIIQQKCGIGTDEWNVRSKAIRWIKAIQERFSLPQKQEWSEEDDKRVKEAIKRIDELEFLGIPCSNVRNVLESLRNRPKSSDTWKPSEEQILAIVEALKYLPNNKDEWMILNTLIAVLRKLM